MNALVVAHLIADVLQIRIDEEIASDVAKHVTRAVKTMLRHQHPEYANHCREIRHTLGLFQLEIKKEDVLDYAQKTIEKVIEVGTIVRLHGRKRTAVVKQLSAGKAQNMVLLNKPLGGASMHNINDLQVVAKPVK